MSHFTYVTFQWEFSCFVPWKWRCVEYFIAGRKQYSFAVLRSSSSVDASFIFLCVFRDCACIYMSVFHVWLCVSCVLLCMLCVCVCVFMLLWWRSRHMNKVEANSSGRSDYFCGWICAPGELPVLFVPVKMELCLQFWQWLSYINKVQWNCFKEQTLIFEVIAYNLLNGLMGC